MADERDVRDEEVDPFTAADRSGDGDEPVEDVSTFDAVEEIETGDETPAEDQAFVADEVDTPKAQLSEADAAEAVARAEDQPVAVNAADLDDDEEPEDVVPEDAEYEVLNDTAKVQDFVGENRDERNRLLQKVDGRVKNLDGRNRDELR